MPSLWITLSEAFETAQKSQEGFREEEFREFLRHGEIESRADTLTISGRVKGRVAMVFPRPKVENLAPLDAAFWQKAEVDFLTSSAAHKKAGTTIASAVGILVRRADVDRLWPSQEAPVKNQGGRLRKWDWEGAIVEMGRRVFVDGYTKTQAEMVDHLQQWFSKHYKGEPAVSGTKERVSRFYEALQLKPPADN